MPGEKRKVAKPALERENKRKAPGFICGCEEENHANEAECEREKSLIIHKDIADK
jgi:hypothetical protein